VNKETVLRRIQFLEVEPLHLLGESDLNLRAIAERFNTVSIVARGNSITLEGPPEDVGKAEALFLELISLVRQGKVLTEADIQYAVSLVDDEARPALAQIWGGKDAFFDLRRPVKPKTFGQGEYAKSIQESDIVFAIGPAGTGKTYIAVAAAVTALKRRAVSRIVLVRPAVEAGESLGFLPGDFQEKVDPYLRPLYDALHEMMGADKIRRSLEMGVIEVAPLAYMRGRTLSDSFVILDEAQNTTIGQMKMFLTRLGANSKAVITGDVTQIDLREKDLSGLIQIQGILRDVEGIKFCYFTEKDVVRHLLVKKIIKAFEDHDANGHSRNGDPRPAGPPANPPKAG
jgi:phosphate starvation-inducible PhoH-like protein